MTHSLGYTYANRTRYGCMFSKHTRGNEFHPRGIPATTIPIPRDSCHPRPLANLQWECSRDLRQTERCYLCTAAAVASKDISTWEGRWLTVF